jgi:predicted ATPase
MRAVADMEYVILQQALDRLAEADILLVQGLPPESDYRFKHALIQDAAYENLLKSRRQVLHRHIAEILGDQFAASAAAEPELLAHHFTQAGQIEVAIEWWGKAGQRSLERSALVEAAAQFTRALDQIATIPATPGLRRVQIKLQVALANALMHTKGHAAAETKARLDRANYLIERAEALGEYSDDPLLLFSILYGRWVANYGAFNGDAMRELSEQFLALAQKQGTSSPLMLGHRLMGHSLLNLGNLVDSRTHLDRAIELYDPAEHRALATRFGQDSRVTILSRRSTALWLLGYPEAALADLDYAVKDAREVGHAATLMYALFIASITHILCGNCAAAKAEADEVIALADEKGALVWKAYGVMTQGLLFAVIGKSAHAVKTLISGITMYRSVGSKAFLPFFLSYLASAYADASQFGDAWRCISEATTAVGTTNERWCESDVHRIAGEIAIASPQRDTAKAAGYFERAHAVARQQQAKSWQLRASMSLARLWRSQGKVQQARELLAPIYGWFTEGFDTRDLKEAKALLEELA